MVIGIYRILKCNSFDETFSFIDHSKALVLNPTFEAAIVNLCFLWRRACYIYLPIHLLLVRCEILKLCQDIVKPKKFAFFYQQDMCHATKLKLGYLDYFLAINALENMLSYYPMTLHIKFSILFCSPCKDLSSSKFLIHLFQLSQNVRTYSRKHFGYIPQNSQHVSPIY